MTLTEKHGLPLHVGHDGRIRDEGGDQYYGVLGGNREFLVSAANLLGQAEREGWVEHLRLVTRNLRGHGLAIHAGKVEEAADAIDAAIRGAS